MHAITLTGIKYGVLTETEWEGRKAVRLNQNVPGLYLRKADLETGFNDDGAQVKPLAVRITAELGAVDAQRARAGWTRSTKKDDPFMHQLFTSAGK